MSKTINFIGLLILLTSCNSTKLIPADKRITIDNTNIDQLKGKYDNRSVDTIYWKRTTIWKHLKPFPNDGNFWTSKSTVTINFVDKDKIQFCRYDSLDVKEIKTFKYKIKDGVLLIKSRQNKVLKGVPLIFYRGHHETLNIALDKNSNLIIAYDGQVSGGPFIIIFGSSIIGTQTFLRR